MPKPRVLILRAPGTNCDLETAFAFEQAGGAPERVHVGRVLEAPGLLAAYQILCIPGGFSYGDDLAAGRILGSQIQHRLRGALAEFRASGKLVLGICNGFQVLIKSGLLLEGDAERGPEATLTWNDCGRFQDRWIHVRAEGDRCVFLRGIESMYLPIAHAEGKFVPRDRRRRLGRYGIDPGRRGVAVSHQPQRLGLRSGRRLRFDGPRVRPDATPRAARRPHSASGMDQARRTARGGRRDGRVRQRG
jgi:phosphoribosylformylglycinamidine (FGAM) synthase-like amidotransferase family enzyme